MNLARPAGSCMISQGVLSNWNQFQSLLNNGTPTVGLIYVCPVILYCGASRMHSSKAAVVNTLSEPLRCPLLILLSAISVSKETWPLCMHKKLQRCHCGHFAVLANPKMSPFKSTHDDVSLLETSMPLGSCFSVTFSIQKAVQTHSETLHFSGFAVVVIKALSQKYNS